MSSPQMITRVPSNSAGLTEEAIARLNHEYRPLGFEERIRRLYQDFEVGNVLVTSSFAATSAYFLHIISSLRPDQPIHFINTGFHFPETLKYRDYLSELFGLTVLDVNPDDHHHQYSLNENLWNTDPDLCCSVNKVEPLEAVKLDFEVWVSSLMGWQTDHRAGLDIFEERRGIIKFNPMIDVTREQRDAYIAEHQLPFHPLVAEGYSSIGCSHCTVKGDGRSGRWQGKPKTECGLHL
ncbi:MAG: phosphoadenylyl-sulfate reductase [Gammaproteobacteria bacterium HGW-Gammaproteobacteria-14]|nr:MAG: phosphoadenylyl-sulfate reductase [Gammaproteobacteria bacterium HGW-Gammaproteobacteria-14]